MFHSNFFSIGYSFYASGRWSEAELIIGARFLGDQNPFHNDVDAARTGRFGRLIACGPHISGIHACLLPTHCTTRGLEVIGTSFTTRYSAPVFAHVAYVMSWEVVGLVTHRSGGTLVDWTGTVTSEASPRPSIEATGQVLVSGPTLTPQDDQHHERTRPKSYVDSGNQI
jgi:acyl dehydratase